MLTDTHAHLTFKDFTADLDALLARADTAGIKRIVTIGTTLDSSRHALALAERDPRIWAAVGVHPGNAHEEKRDFLPELRDLARHPRTVAIGEAGLDYYRLPDDPAEIARIKEIQRLAFEDQLSLAAELGLNVVVHQRASWDDTVAQLRPWSDRLRAVFHCFGETPERMNQILALGHLVSFTGIVTFKNAPLVQASAAAVPADRYMVETDCPYLAPIPHRGTRCEPAFTRLTAEFIATLRGQTVEQVASDTERTVASFFRMR